MKRIIKLLICLLVTMLVLTGCCFHHWEDATCEDPKTCLKCGETKGEAKGHDWESATCEDPKTCSVCEKTRGEAKGHEWDGVECMSCGKTRPEPTEVGAVTWDMEYFLKHYEMMLIGTNQSMSIGEMEQISEEEYTFQVYYDGLPASRITLTVDEETEYVLRILAQQDETPLPNANEHGMGHNSCVSTIYAAQISRLPHLINEMHNSPVAQEKQPDRHWWLFRLEDMKIEQTHILGENGWITTVEITHWENG